MTTSGPGPSFYTLAATTNLACYQQLSNKHKKRFLWKPNVAEDVEQLMLCAQEYLPWANWPLKPVTFSLLCSSTSPCCH